jgi:5-methylcytosine-specific restriction endonuclease McrA
MPRLPTATRPRAARDGSATGRRGGRTKAEAIRRHPWCAECGSTESLSGDHIRPRSKCGTDELENIRVLCLTCNKSKGVRTGWETPLEKTTELESEPRLLG